VSFKNVFWVAGSQMPAQKFESVIEDHPDLLNLQNFLDMYKNQVGHFIFLSSGGCVYGPGSGEFSETSSIFPINRYGELKLRCESEITNSLNSFIILRVSNVFGMGQLPSRSQGVIPHWIQASKNSRPIKVFGSLDSYRDYIDIDSLVEAILASTTIFAKEIFNIGSGEKVSLGQLLEIFREFGKSTQEIEYLKARESDRLGYVLSTAKAEGVLGWNKPKKVIENISNLVQYELSL
jgi:UDP-glucose 4-epimerase